MPEWHLVDQKKVELGKKIELKGLGGLILLTGGLIVGAEIIKELKKKK